MVRRQNLTPDSVPGRQDTFVKDLVTGVVTLVNRAPAGPANAGSRAVGISSTGRYVAFVSSATNLVPNFDGVAGQLFVKDLATGAFTLVSSGPRGLADRSISGAKVSADGRYVAFTSSAQNLAPNDPPNLSEIFYKDLQTGALTVVSATPTARANDSSYELSMSADGRYVAFRSNASNLVAGDNNGTGDVFVRDMVTGVIALVSSGPTGQGNGFSSQPSISADGRYLAFWSFASNLVPDGRNGDSDVFVKDLQTGQVRLVSISPTGPGDQQSFNPSVSADGRTIVFSSSATNFTSGDLNSIPDIFVALLPE